MRLLFDTNIIVSGLLSPKGALGRLVRAWLDGRYDLVTSEEQLDELRRVLGYEHLKPLINPAQARDFVENVDALAIVAVDLPTLDVSPDPQSS